MKSASLRTVDITDRARKARSSRSRSSPAGEFPARELVDRCQQQAAVVGEVLRVLGAAAGIDDGGHVVDAEVLLDEAARGRFHTRGAREIGVQVVEDDQIDTALDAFVGLHIRLDRLRRKDGPIRALNRDLHAGKRGDLLGLAVFEQFEIRGGQVGDDLPFRVGDKSVHFDVVHLDQKADRRRLLRGRSGAGRLLGADLGWSDRGQARQHHAGDDDEQCGRESISHSWSGQLA
jgi:hypothetical protein